MELGSSGEHQEPEVSAVEKLGSMSVDAATGSDMVPTDAVHIPIRHRPHLVRLGKHVFEIT